MSNRGLVIVVCRNGLSYTRECVKTLLALEGSPQVLIVDNASSDGTGKWASSVAALNPGVWVRIYPFVETLSRVWNKALRWAWITGRTEALVVNNDTELRTETYKLLHRVLVFEPPVSRLGMLTAVGVNTREQFQDPVTISYRPHPDFSCFMIAKWAWEKVGGFDERYEGAHYEDNDMHVRLHRARITAFSCGVPFLHHARGTLKTAGYAETERITRNCFANKRRFIAQYGCSPNSLAYEDLFK